MGTVKSSNKILITGANGQLGQKLILNCLEQNIDFLATANSEKRFLSCPDEVFEVMDITNVSQVKKVVKQYKPTHIINAAAMTNVDLCEEQKELCYAINRDGVKNLLEAAIEENAHLIQISTDFIFDGKKECYSEEDEPNPLGVYGKSKWEGEKVLNENGYPKISILRTSILYGQGENLKKPNLFVWAMNELRKGNTLNIVNDQFRTPTYVDDLARACLLVIDKNAYGVYNISGEKRASMYDFILDVADYLKVSHQQINPISSEELSQKAPRPLSSGLNIIKAKTILGYRPTKFIETLSRIDLVD